MQSSLISCKLKATKIRFENMQIQNPIMKILIYSIILTK